MADGVTAAEQHQASVDIGIKCACGISLSINQSPDPTSALRLACLLWDEHIKAHEQGEAT